MQVKRRDVRSPSSLNEPAAIAALPAPVAFPARSSFPHSHPKTDRTRRFPTSAFRPRSPAGWTDAGQEGGASCRSSTGEPLRLPALSGGASRASRLVSSSCRLPDARARAGRRNTSRASNRSMRSRSAEHNVTSCPIGTEHTASAARTRFVERELSEEPSPRRSLYMASTARRTSCPTARRAAEASPPALTPPPHGPSASAVRATADARDWWRPPRTDAGPSRPIRPRAARSFSGCYLRSTPDAAPLSSEAEPYKLDVACCPPP